jgi:CrcB protein
VQSILLISLGAIIGANLRYWIAQYTARVVPSGFPYGTFIINLSASFVIGFFLIWSTERVLVDPRWRTFVAIGFCGSYSTYSSYAFETLALFEKGQWAAAAANILCTNVLCFSAVVLGAALARAIR